MKLKYIVKIFVITYLFFGITNSSAENKVVYIDMNKILNESKVGAFVEKELTKLHEKKLDNFNKTEENLKKKEIDLISKRNILARNEFDAKVKLLNEEAQKYQVERRKWFDEIAAKRNKARSEVLKSLDPIIANHFEKNQISLILYKRNIAIASSELDITDAIIDELNKKLPSIKLN
jgi:Skp family chaperone for outer membrane proteins|tara:strand:- start:538 stop:1068 length:531 start_codon:yes stop_codon:yes gene_type:complete